MKPQTLIRLAIAVAIATPPLALTSGCVAVAAAGAAGGTVAYLRGDLETAFHAPIEKVQRAISQALQNDLQLHMISTNQDALSGKYVARTAKDERIVITLSSRSPELTEMTIRVGIFGNEDLSRRILTAIEERLWQ